MLNSSWHHGQAFVIRATSELNPNMTVAELFEAGPIRFVVSCEAQDGPRVDVLIPEVLEVASEPEPNAADANHFQADLFGDGPDRFDSFLQEEAVRVALEAATIRELKVARSNVAGGSLPTSTSLPQSRNS